jgi:competence protein ComEC
MRLPRLPSCAEVLAGLRTEAAAQADRWFLWAPVAFAAGCAIYLALPREPLLVFAPVVGAVSVVAALVVRRSAPGRTFLVAAATLLAFIACGFAAGRVRAELVAAPQVPQHATRTVEGWVVDVASPGKTGGRLIIAPYEISGFAPDALPRRLRITFKDGAAVAPGSAVRLRAILNPSPAPASPGAYDFARDSYFRGIGGVGFALGPARLVDAPRAPFLLGLTLRLNAARWELANRMAERLGPEAAGLGVAMVTGHEAWMVDENETALRNSGLAHIISISGVHMAIVGGFVFLLLRIFIAAWPWLALRAPGKKIAAAGALAAIAVYLLVSGAPPPAIRSAITLSVAFLAVLFDRQAITLHSLAVAALLILAVQPEAVAQPGFGMSFSATAALLALAEAWPRPAREINAPWPIRVVQRLRGWLAAAFAASLVAGLATSPFAIQHFNRVALFGLPANLLSEPLSGLLVLPCLALGAIAEALNLPDPFLPAAGWGIEALQRLATWFATLPHAVLVSPSAPAWALPVSVLGLFWICIWKGRARWLGLPAALAVSLAPRPPVPAAWIAADGGGAAVVDGASAIFLRPGVKAFASDLWSRRRGVVVPSGDAEQALAAHYDCNRQRCWWRSDLRPRINAWWTRRQPSESDLDHLCNGADVVIVKADAALPARCSRSVVLTADDFAAGGASEIYWTGSKWRFDWAQPHRGDRPWTRGDVDQ